MAKKRDLVYFEMNLLKLKENEIEVKEIDEDPEENYDVEGEYWNGQ